MQPDLLARFAEPLGLAPAEARPVLARLVASIHRTIEAQGGVFVPGVGTFRRQGGTLTFEATPDLADAVNHRYAGLAPLAPHTAADHAEAPLPALELDAPLRLSLPAPPPLRDLGDPPAPPAEDVRLPEESAPDLPPPPPALPTEPFTLSLDSAPDDLAALDDSEGLLDDVWASPDDLPPPEPLDVSPPDLEAPLALSDLPAWYDEEPLLEGAPSAEDTAPIAFAEIVDDEAPVSDPVSDTPMPDAPETPSPLGFDTLAALEAPPLFDDPTADTDHDGSDGLLPSPELDALHGTDDAGASLTPDAEPPSFTDAPLSGEATLPDFLDPTPLLESESDDAPLPDSLLQTSFLDLSDLAPVDAEPAGDAPAFGVPDREGDGGAPASDSEDVDLVSAALEATEFDTFAVDELEDDEPEDTATGSVASGEAPGEASLIDVTSATDFLSMPASEEASSEIVPPEIAPSTMEGSADIPDPPPLGPASGENPSTSDEDADPLRPPATEFFGFAPPSYDDAQPDEPFSADFDASPESGEGREAFADTDLTLEEGLDDSEATVAPQTQATEGRSDTFAVDTFAMDAFAADTSTADSPTADLDDAELPPDHRHDDDAVLETVPMSEPSSWASPDVEVSDVGASDAGTSDVETSDLEASDRWLTEMADVAEDAGPAALPLDASSADEPTAAELHDDSPTDQDWTERQDPSEDETAASLAPHLLGGFAALGGAGALWSSRESEDEAVDAPVSGEPAPDPASPLSDPVRSETPSSEIPSSEIVPPADDLGEPEAALIPDEATEPLDAIYGEDVHGEGDSDEPPAEEPLSEERPAEERPAEERPAEERPAEERSSGDASDDVPFGSDAAWMTPSAEPASAPLSPASEIHLDASPPPAVYDPDDPAGPLGAPWSGGTASDASTGPPPVFPHGIPPADPETMPLTADLFEETTAPAVAATADASAVQDEEKTSAWPWLLLLLLLVLLPVGGYFLWQQLSAPTEADVTLTTPPTTPDGDAGLQPDPSGASDASLPDDADAPPDPFDSDTPVDDVPVADAPADDVPESLLAEEPPADAPAPAPPTGLYGDGGLDLDQGGYTWVVTNPDGGRTPAQQVAQYRAQGLRSGVVRGRVDGAVVERVCLGQFATLESAREARPQLPGSVPASSWVLRLSSPTVVR